MDEEQEGMIDFRVLAQDGESSMNALNAGEDQRLENAFTNYQPMIQNAGIEHIIDDLRATLTSRYLQNPAVLMWPGNNQPLPLTWAEFQALRLSQEAKTEAIKAYAQNKDHTALRFLSKPNHWMHHNANFIHTNQFNNEKHSYFIECQREICLFYLAAMDTEFLPDGFTLETRLEGFIDELAHIGRAHNWDNRRPKTGDVGELLFDINGILITEEFDDLQADRPSCYPGMKRRLFQSVRGHALLSMLTKDMIKEELRDFVRQHVKENVNKYNRSAINVAWNKAVYEGEDLTSEDLAALRILDIPPEKQATLIAFLGRKYGNQFTNNPVFKALIETAFSLKNSQDAHVLNFGHFQPDDFFNKPGNDEVVPAPKSVQVPDLSCWLNQYSVGLCVAAFSGLIEAFVIHAMAVSLTTTLALLTAIGGPIALGVLAGIVYDNLYHAVAPLI